MRKYLNLQLVILILYFESLYHIDSALDDDTDNLVKSRSKRFLGCDTVLTCLGDAVRIVPLRYSIKLITIYKRLTGDIDFRL